MFNGDYGQRGVCMTNDYNEAGNATARIDIRVPKELKEEMKEEAKNRGITVTELLLESYRKIRDGEIISFE